MMKEGMKYIKPDKPHPQYVRQQKVINETCDALGLKAYYPNYHGAAHDKNTVLVYFAEDYDFNADLDTRFSYSWEYRDPIWAFENTDANGNGTYEFANRGTLDLRGLDADDVIRASIRQARCLRCAYCGDCASFDDAFFVAHKDEDTPEEKQHYCCCGDTGYFGKNIKEVAKSACDCFEEI